MNDVAEALDFYIDADDAYTPAKLPQGAVKMGGEKYPVRCPKDSLPILLGRIESRAPEIKSAEGYEDVIRQICAAVFTSEDTEKIIERIISPYEEKLSIAFLLDTVRRVYEKYGPYLDQAYEELGLENPTKQPTDRKAPTSKRAAAKKVPAKKASSRKPAAARAARA
ncbi:hypothetical protein ACFPC0_11110 [Streptomyces andamanensis]|uniref:Tail assembly chaperone n=1 Tax=Streptomyces andamanensis TaxID=1565035 RepID=A0ABV8TCL9_9ACTN